MNRVTKSPELQGALMKCLSVPDKKMNTVLMCDVPLMVNIDIYWAHEELCEVQCWKMYPFLQNALWLKISHVVFYCYVSQISLYKVKVVPVLHQVSRQEEVWGSRGTAPRILNLGTTWRWVVSFTPRPLYHRERAHGDRLIGSWVVPKAGL
jgi:hypothetical protein